MPVNHCGLATVVAEILTDAAYVHHLGGASTRLHVFRLGGAERD